MEEEEEEEYNHDDEDDDDDAADKRKIRPGMLVHLIRSIIMMM